MTRALIAIAAALALAPAVKAAGAELRNLPGPGAFEIDGAPSGASFERRGRIEQKTASGWVTVFGEYDLVADCASAAATPACVTVAPGATLRPVPWNGYTCNGQCPRPCKGNAYRPPGVFRLVLTQCGGGAVVGAPFAMGTER